MPGNIFGGNQGYGSNQNFSQNFGGQQYPQNIQPNDIRASMRNSMNDGYSAHSIKDRMIDSLERLMDNAATEYERDEIRREIEEIRKDK